MAITEKNSMKDLFAGFGIDYVDPEEAAKTAADTVLAKYASDRTDLANTTNQYYNQLYNTQNTVMDTIRQSNAQAVASGASKGVQAANTLASILGLQNESVQSATELANESIKLAQDETAAVLEAEQAARDTVENINTQRLSIIPEMQNANTAEWSAFKDAYFQAEADDKPGLAAQFLNKLWGLNANTDDTTTTITASDPTNVRSISIDDPTSWDYIDQADVNSKGLNGDAGAYVKKVLTDAKDGLIKPGEVVNFNYGKVAPGLFGGTKLSYKYLGNGKWEKIPDQNPTYVPDGYTAI